MKILNLYAGIGGNRRLWGNKHEITAIEYDENIANIYKDNFPNDKVIICDAHEYLLEHFREYDFIWSSPPCPTHSRIRKTLAFKKLKDGTIFEQNKPVYPDMRLYQEIILLDNYFNGLYCVENVQSYYVPLIEPQKIGRHYIWANFKISEFKDNKSCKFDSIKELQELKGFNLDNYRGIDKRAVIRNCVLSELGKHILDSLKVKSEI